MSDRLLPGMAAYVKDFETGWRNPHRIKVRIYFHHTGEVIEQPLRLTRAGNLAPADKARLLPPAKGKRKRANSGVSAAAPSLINPVSKGQVNE